MGRPRHPERDKSKERYIQSKGKLTTKELAELAGVTPQRIRKWKSEDKWDTAIAPRKKGGQKGNKNAAGKTPAKNGNKNAEKHGIYSRVDLDRITGEEEALIENAKHYDIVQKINEEYTKLIVKESRLQKMLDEIIEETKKEPDKTYIDSVTTMEGDQTLEIRNSSSAFERMKKIEEQLIRVHRSIIKLLDTMKAHEMEALKLQLDKKKNELQRMKLTGEVSIEPEPEEYEIIDE